MTQASKKKDPKRRRYIWVMPDDVKRLVSVLVNIGCFDDACIVTKQLRYARASVMVRRSDLLVIKLSIPTVRVSKTFTELLKL